MFDEPSSFLDVKQRLAASRLIRSLLRPDCYVIVVEHDLSVLDYLSDYICVLYGKPAVYGVVTAPFSVREGINIFLDGNIPTENLRFRDESLQFRIAEAGEDYLVDKSRAYKYPTMQKTLGDFQLNIKGGEFTDSEILVMMGENGTGKTTFCRMLAGAEKPDDGKQIPPMSVSMKPQTITAKFKGTVRQLFFKKIKTAYLNPQFQTDVYKPMKLDDFIDQEVQNLSGGELQRVAIVLALGIPADIYLIDEPSAYLDSEQRIVAARVIKRYIMHSKKTAFVVEHDFIMATYLADRVIVFDGQPSVKSQANRPESLLTGCNRFLESLEVTFRRDPNTYRPRINKMDSQLDTEQKNAGNYFFLEDES
jgi:ATP-binding cassette, sub-family E, member 1